MKEKIFAIGFIFLVISANAFAQEIDRYSVNMPSFGCNMSTYDANGKQIIIQGETGSPAFSSGAEYLEPCSIIFNPVELGKNYKYCALSGVFTSVGFQPKPGCAVYYTDKHGKTGKPAVDVLVQGAGTICQFWCVKETTKKGK